jgi:hypothetical protein
VLGIALITWLVYVVVQAVGGDPVRAIGRRRLLIMAALLGVAVPVAGYVAGDLVGTGGAPWAVAVAAALGTYLGLIAGWGKALRRLADRAPTAAIPAPPD